MLHVFYGDLPTAIYNTAVYFKNVYEDAWLTTPPVPQMIEDIDQSTVISGGVIDSPVFGKISPLGLSGGVKTLILIHNVPEKIFNASTCGDNCASWLLRLAEEKDITVNLRHLMDFGKGTFSLHILNTDQTVHNMKELVPIAGRFV